MNEPDTDAEYVEYVRGRIPALRRLAFLLCGDEHRADDLVQTAITNLYVHWARARAATHLDNYVRTIVVRAFLDERRLSWAKVRLFGSPPEPAPAAGPGQQQGPEDRVVLRAALARVPRRQQAVLVLRFLYDLPVDDVAEILGCSPGTVKSQTTHGLAKLRKLIDDRPRTVEARP